MVALTHEKMKIPKKKNKKAYHGTPMIKSSRKMAGMTIRVMRYLARAILILLVTVSLL